MTASVAADISSQLHAALEENERLRTRLGAVRHSLGNHLALMSAILSRQARGCELAEAQNALNAAQGRITAIAEALRVLMIEPDLNEIEVGEPVARLINEFRAHASDLGVEVSSQVDASALRADDAVSLMLVLNELASNALQHAFPDDARGKMRILLRREGAVLTLDVQDDGIGVALGAESGLGGKIITSALRTLAATITEAPSRVHSTRPGRRVVVTKLLA